MPSALSYPGVYVEEIPSGVRTITAVPTSTTAFVGRTRKGPIDEAVEITSYGDFERIFGGLSTDSTLSYAVRDFYLNGGARAVIVRLFRGSASAAVKQIVDAVKVKSNGKDAKAEAKKVKDKIDVSGEPVEKAAATRVLAIFDALPDGAKEEVVKATAEEVISGGAPEDHATIEVGPLRFTVKSPGQWVVNLRITVERAIGAASASAKQPAERLAVDPEDLFKLTVTDESVGGSSETYVNLTVKHSVRRVDKVLASESKLIEWAGENLDTTVPSLTVFNPSLGDDVVNARNGLADAKTKYNLDASDDNKKALKTKESDLEAAWAKVRSSVGAELELDSPTFLNGGRQGKKGLFALEHLFTRGGIFNLLCIPPYKADGGIDRGVLAEAVVYAEYRRAMVIVDPPVAWKKVGDARKRFGEDTDNLPRSKNAAVFFPRVKQPNPLHDDQLEEFAPCGVVAGIFARTDVQRGVWKSPAGLDASLVGVSTLTVPMTDEENGLLNPLGINCLRTFPVFGRVVWGARTLRGADDYADEYKYIPVRRTALFIEESLYRGLKWAVFEPNDEPLWAQIRLNVGAFMHNLFRQGAFQGASKRDAYFVKCDASTTTQNDINLGIVNVLVGFAPLKPAEFVVIKLQQIAGSIET
jgi:uncharacterized protein